MKLFLDTNVLLRFYLRDYEEQFAQVKQLITAIESGKHRPYISTTVLLEMAYVLRKLYGLPKKEVLTAIRSVMGMRGLVVVDKAHTAGAIALFAKKSIAFADCILATQVRSDMTLVTFDQQLAKLVRHAKTPAALV